MSDRDDFLAVLSTPTPTKADAIVVLCGEDGAARAEAGAELFKLGFAPRIVLSGGVSDTRRMSASDVHGTVLGAGVGPDRIILHGSPRNTREQAELAIAKATGMQWDRVLIVASAYHMPRAFLTFVATMIEWGVDHSLRVVPCPVRAPWFGCPTNCEETRLALYARELAKIDEYRTLGHVASYHSGLFYLQEWEGK